MGRHIDIYITIWSNQHVITDGNTTDDSGVDSYPHLISNRRNPFVLTTIRLANDHAFMDIAVSPNARFWINRDVIGMTYIDTPPQIGP